MPSLLIRGGVYHGIGDSLHGALRGPDLARLPFLENGFLLAENGIITALGALAEAPDRADQVIDASGKHILPTWCDSHTHTVFARSREQEFVYRLKGLTYEEIAAKGGGILNSADALREMSEDVLFESALRRVFAMIAQGTGALEIKSGYGLSTQSEIKMLRVIRRIREAVEIPVRATFLGAHAIPRAYRDNRQGYIRLIIDEMIPRIQAESLADYIDVFCDRGFFTVTETAQIVEAGLKAGLKPKLHVSELDNIGGVQLGIRHNALSVDHLECAGEQEIRALGSASTIATLLPSCAFFLNLSYPDARGLINAGAAVALATDFNPGTSPSGRMPFVISLACIKMGMLPEEAINAATINGAFAMEVHDKVGRLAPGLRANFIITKTIPSVEYLPYAFGEDVVGQVYICGREFTESK